MRPSEDILITTPKSLDSFQISRVIPSTASQIEIWLSCQLGGKEANMAYNESMSIKLHGELEILYLKTAFHTVIQRHEGMRATFTPDGDQMIIFSSFHLPLRFRDITQLNEEKEIAFLKKHSLDTGVYEFDLVKGPLYVLELIKVREEEHILTFTGHHLIFDGWSCGLLLEEISMVYTQLKNGQSIQLPKEDKLSDFIVQHYRLTHCPEIEKTRSYWKNELSDPDPHFDLPIDFERPAVRKLKAKRLEVALPKSLLAKAKKFAVEKKVSSNLLLLSVFEVFLFEWTGQKDIIVGVPMAGQAILNKLNLIAHCVNLLPMRSRIDRNLTFEEYLQMRKSKFNDSLDHSLISFGALLQDLHIKRDTSRFPLIPITFNLSVTNSSSIKFEGLTSSLISNPKSYSNFEIIVDLFGNEEEIIVEWTYNESLFDESSIWEAAQKYNLLIEKIIDAPHEKLSGLDSFFENTGLETELLLHHRSSNGISDERGNSKQSIETQAARFPEKIAITFKNESLDYATLNSRANQIAHYLINRGVKSGDYVGIYLERSCNLIVSILGVIKSGAACLPIDREIPIERAKYMVKDSEAKFLITDFFSLEWNDIYYKTLYINELNKVICGYSEENPSVEILPEDPIYTIYTSGSTGNPKGVILSHRNLIYFTNHTCKELGYTSDDSIAGVTSVSFDVSMMEMVIPFLLGATLHLVDRYDRKDPKQILALLKEKKITKMFATPTHWQMIVQSGWNERFSNLTVISGGEELKKSLAYSLNKYSKEVWNVYGPTETTIFATCKKVKPDDQEITLGKAVKGTEIYLVDENSKLISDSGLAGEIWISGEGVAKAYIGLEKLTQEKFSKNPFKNDNSRIYKTGDLGSWTPNGELNYLGRIDHQVKIRGYRVELGEIEQRLISFPEVENAVVINRKEAEGINNLVGCLLVKKEFGRTRLKADFIKQIQSDLSKVLPEYMVPSHFYFFEDFPLTTSGKIDRIALTGLLDTQDDFSSNSNENSLLTADELKVFTIWKTVLRRDNFGIDDDFFLLGGHSLLGVRVVSKLETEFDVSLSLLTLFQFPTIRGLVVHINGLKEEDTDSIVLIKKGSPHKVLCFVHGVGLNPVEINTLTRNMDEDQTIWGLQSPAVSGNHEPLESIEEMATFFINELDKQKINMPYNLIGNSIGGLIAFEMAKQLINKNRQVGFLGMIDTLAVHSQDPVLSFTQSMNIKISKLKFEFNFFWNDPLYYLKYRVRYLQEMGRKKFGINEEENALDYRIRKIEGINENAWINHKLTYLDIKITLFLAKRRTFFVKDFKTFGWGEFTEKVNTIEMPGEHANMLKPPYGSEFTKCLQRELNHYSKN
ncbi:amino acid adenylation domain-containing protein [Algoriphagus sp. C2-6-M1]|uniref:amino acid adenylation domain-containing protein n=1 Tax=Algoriphagus persicinus TaxID=3108754 RepID=UPI002B3DA786|nr:amino acid adenylation domain-containing protein [Algoriphagus sp. C2-6-M1]MEB2782616.1 amino acid adenylation domain-containing protein [Algoriphagus sp. C2-6-M1]